MLDAVDDPGIFPKDDIAVLPHQFQCQDLCAKIAHFIVVFDFKVDDPLHRRLGNRSDHSILNVLPKQHAESRCLQWRGLIFFRQISDRKRGVCRHQKTFLIPIFFDRK